MEEKFVKQMYPAARVGVHVDKGWVVYSHINTSIRKIIGYGNSPANAWKDAKKYVQNELHLLK